MWIYRLSKELSASQGLLHADSLHGMTHTKRLQAMTWQLTSGLIET
jgi:hypothetical protein